METQRYYTSICGALLKLSNKNKLSEFDLSFVDNWLAKRWLADNFMLVSKLEM